MHYKTIVKLTYGELYLNYCKSTFGTNFIWKKYTHALTPNFVKLQQVTYGASILDYKVN